MMVPGMPIIDISCGARVNGPRMRSRKVLSIITIVPGSRNEISVVVEVSMVELISSVPRV